MAVELATAYISLVPSLQGAQGAIASEFGGAGVSAGRVFGGTFAGSFAGNLAASAFRAVGSSIAKLVGTGFEESKEAEVANAQLTAAIQSTGNAANTSIGELNALASSIQGYSGQTDDSIAATQALLLRFTSIKNVGADRIFDDATRAAADMAARLGGDAASQAQKLGRALEDPIAGVNQLARSGVIFTQQQKDQVAAMVAAGDTLGAQRIILDQVNAAYGGSAAAFGNTFPGAVEKVKRSFEDFSQATVQGILPLFTPILNGISTALIGLAPVAERVGAVLSSGVGAAIEFLGPLFQQIGATVGPLVGQFIQLWTSISPLSLVFKAIQPLLPQLLSAFGALASTVGGALGQAFTTLLPVFQQLGQVISGALGKALSSLLPVFIQLVGIVGPIFSTVLTALLPIIVTLAGIFGQLIEAIVPLLDPILGLIVPLAELVAAILPPLVDLFAALLGPILELVSPLLNLLMPVLQFLVTVLTTIIGGIVDVITWFVNLATGSEEASGQLSSIWQGVLDFFGDIWDGIVSFFSDGIANAIALVTGLPGQILAALGNLGSLLYTAGRDLINGLIEGAQSLLRNIGKFFLDVLPSWIVEPFKVALGIHSPSVVFRDLGAEIPAGLNLGIQDGARAVTATMANLVDPNLSNSLRSSAVAVAGLGAVTANRPIYMDGSLIGWMRDVANGQAQIVLNQWDDNTSQIIGNGKKG